METQVKSTVSSPLFFTFSRVLFGNGFAADVTIPKGRALLVQEHDGVWMYGVNPGALAGGGDNLAEAHGDFVSRLVSVFLDIASDSKDFGKFKAAVEKFFYSATGEDRWKDAVKAVKAGKVSETVSGLPKSSAESEPEISITKVASEKDFKVTLNAPAGLPTLRAAA